MVFHLGMEFQLHPRLAAGGFELGQVDSCRVLLKNHASFPWILIVPEVADGIEDLHQLDERRYAEVVGLIRRVSLFVADYFRPEKLNVGCIGNMVRQMHIHVVGRNSDDPAWPSTVWAYEGKSAYAPEAIRVAAREALGLE
ncbi:MAG: hypothetical protein B9S30_07305 [Verrucomicrobiia bacterium Tous-C5FEB]|nr:MAG: hypothetical protein B9S30_07305 [Verrucomicrobiae bacterium Tous-C5FEB]